MSWFDGKWRTWYLVFLSKRKKTGMRSLAVWNWTFQGCGCLCVKTSLYVKPFVWKCVWSAASFSWKSNLFSWAKFCMKNRFETEAKLKTTWKWPLGCIFIINNGSTFPWNTKYRWMENNSQSRIVKYFSGFSCGWFLYQLPLYTRVICLVVL